MSLGPQALEFLYTITHFGEATIVAPLVCGAIVALWTVGERRNARTIAIAFALCLAATVLSKILFMFIYRGGPLRSPSGHTALATFVYGSLAVLAWKRASFGALRPSLPRGMRTDNFTERSLAAPKTGRSRVTPTPTSSGSRRSAAVKARDQRKAREIIEKAAVEQGGSTSLAAVGTLPQ